MKTFSISVLGAILFILAEGASAASVAPVTAVTLYPGSATIVRTAQVEAGATQLIIPDLTASFSTETMRIDADHGIRVGQVVMQDAGRTESANSAEVTLANKIQALKDQMAALDAEAGAAEIVKGYLERLGDGASGKSNVPADAKSLTAMLGAIGHGASDALGKKQRAAAQKRELEKKVAALERDLDRLRSDARDGRKITINLRADRAGKIRLSYQLQSAGWKPSYRVELDSATSTVNLERLAQVSQKTGEDWKDVKVSLSTSQPRLYSSASTPSPWLLSYAAPRLASTGSAAYAGKPAAPAKLDVRLPPVESRSSGGNDYSAPTFWTDGTFTTEFHVPALATIPADGREVVLSLGKQSLPAKQRVQVSPRLDTTAIVTVQAERPSGVWPGGNLQTYRDGNYVGAAYWNPQGLDKFFFSFGRDDLMRVTLDHVKGNSGSVGVFEKRNQRRITDRITVKSLHTTPVNVLVVEASPVSTSDEIKVETSFDPKPTAETWEQQRGVLAWERTLAPNEALVVAIDYLIEYPKEGSVSGL